MADWRINEKYRKPRRAKGTPLFVFRNYYALGGLAFGGISWYLYELWPESQKLRRAQLEGKFDYPEGYQQKLEKKRYRKMKKNRPNNHGSLKSSILNQTSKNRASSSIRSHSPKENGESFDSPYKNSLSEIKQIALNNDEADDFRTPIPFKKTSKNVSKNQAVPKKSGRKFQRKLTSLLQKQTEDNLKNLDVNPDHLQMALALSKSTLAEENPEEFRKSQEQDLPVFLSPEKIPKGKTVLERFGFKSSKLKLHAEFQEGHHEDLGKRKYSKFRFVTPTLHTRTDEERETLITAKISLIISQKKQSILENSYEFQEIITSSLLEEYHCKENHILNINKIASSELKLFCYYCNSLKIPQNKSTYGCLLKKWNEIPGREKSPERILRTVNRDEFRGRDSVTNSSAKLEKNLANIETLSEKNLLNIESEVIPKNNCPVVILDTDSENSVNVESDSKAIAKHNTPIVILDTQSEDNVIERHQSCASPDLFDSDDSFRAKTPENLNRLSPSLLNLSPSKSPGLLRTSLRSKERFSKNLSIVFNDDNGIEYFESFDTDSESLSKKVLSLKESEEIKFLDPPEDAGPIDLTQSSSSNDNCFLDIDNTESDAATPDENKVPNDPCTFQQTYQSTFEMSPLVLKNSEEQGSESDEEFLDMTQKSPSHEKNISDEIAQFDPIIDEIADLNEKQEHIPIIEDISLYKYFAESFEKSRRISENSVKSCPSTSKDSLRQSNEYDCTKTLNVTDYITQMLNSQPDEAASQNNSDNLTQGSSSEDTILISDEELNYSSIQSREHKEFNDFYNLSKFDEKCPEVAELDEEELDNIHSDLRNKYGSQSSQRSNEDVDLNQHFDIEIEANDLVDCATPKKVVNNINEPKSPKKCKAISHRNNTKDVSTPTNNFIMKTTDVTPMVNYDQMDTPSIRKELDKFGMKPLKRQRAIKLLKHIYESTHPLVSSTGISSPDQAEEEVEERAVKRRKTIDLADTDLVGEEELIFERKISSKVVSCRLPLQIAWYNFVSENIELQDNILLYEPIHLEIVHCMLKEQSGCKFHVEDLITFLDRKCITFRTTQSQGARTKK